MSQHKFWIEGMTCRSCEITIEQSWKKVPGVTSVKVNSATGAARLIAEGNEPTVEMLQQALGDSHYIVRDTPNTARVPQRPSWRELIGLFALVFLIGFILSKIGLFKTSITLNSGLSFGAVFIIGLVAASSSCVAVVGGLLLSSAAKFNERYASARPVARMRPVVLFVAGRVMSYAILGGLLGVVGSAITPSPIITATIMIIAACYMLIMGLEMLHLTPAWMRRLMPRLPKRWSHAIMNAQGKEHPVAPFALGAATFFLPCGFTQALQLYALTTGSFLTSAGILLALSLATSPALFVLGYASSSVKGKIGQWFFKFSGALVIVLALWNIQNGLAIAGVPTSLLSFGNNQTAVAATSGTTIVDGAQVVKMSVNYTGYRPNHFTVRAGIPVRWEIDGSNTSGCAMALISRQLGIQKFLNPGKNVINFTPQEPGEVAFSCSMGMYRGSFTVLP